LRRHRFAQAVRRVGTQLGFMMAQVGRDQFPPRSWLKKTGWEPQQKDVDLVDSTELFRGGAIASRASSSSNPEKSQNVNAAAKLPLGIPRSGASGARHLVRCSTKLRAAN